MAKAIAVSNSYDYRVESDLNTLLEAEKIEKDKKRMAKVRALAKQRMLEVAVVATEGESGD